MDKFIEGLDRQFAQLRSDSHKLIEAITPELLYHQPPGTANSLPLHSFGEHLLRSAAVVEQTFGGITTNLWDDPFEWTLPESLPTADKVAGYLDEVEATRKHGFQHFKNDADLLKEIMAPSGPTQLLPLLLDTLARAAHHQGRAWATFEILRSERSNRAKN
ncbi:MAG: hypothetical protein QOH41_1872 [Blastocatellia bacterium]|jgi:hypothetical protein|nr:hypothetical protein [Blastocatellia bacterium]